MSKRSSLTYQVTQLLSNSYSEGFGRSRHADKKNALANEMPIDTYTKDKIYSQNTYNSTRKTCVSFANFCKVEYGVRYLEQIKPEMFTKFIESGSDSGRKYEANTAATYYSQVKKLEIAFNTRNSTKSEFADKSYKKNITENIQVKIKMPREIHDKIIEKAYHSKTENGLAYETARAIGIRALEITRLRMKDFKFKDGKLESIHINRSKGGRNRDIIIRELNNRQLESILKVYNYFKNRIGENDRLFINKVQSYETTFSRIRDSVSEKKNYSGCGIHSMRKEFAQDYYNREIERRTYQRLVETERETPSRQREIEKEIEKEVKEDLTQILGHNRVDVLSSYLE